MAKSFKFKDNMFLSSTGITHNRASLSSILANLLGQKSPTWKSISWTGNDTGGTITTGMNMTSKLVSMRFKSASNDYHYCYTTFYWGGGNNYLMANMYSVTQYIIANSTTDTGFNLTVPSTIKLSAIYYLDI